MNDSNLHPLTAELNYLNQFHHIRFQHQYTFDFNEDDSITLTPSSVNMNSTPILDESEVDSLVDSIMDIYKELAVLDLIDDAFFAGIGEEIDLIERELGHSIETTTNSNQTQKSDTERFRHAMSII